MFTYVNPSVLLTIGAMCRLAQPRDFDAIAAVHRAAFDGDEEVALVRALDAAGALPVSLVAERAARVVGHIAFSPLALEREHTAIEAAALAPLGVLPAWQRQGIGAALVRAGLAQCRALGLDTIVVLGDPAYYARFGFREAPLDAPFAGPALQTISPHPDQLAGARVRYHAAFGLPPAYTQRPWP